MPNYLCFATDPRRILKRQIILFRGEFINLNVDNLVSRVRCRYYIYIYIYSTGSIYMCTYKRRHVGTEWFELKLDSVAFITRVWEMRSIKIVLETLILVNLACFKVLFLYNYISTYWISSIYIIFINEKWGKMFSKVFKNKVFINFLFYCRLFRL